MTFCCKLFVLLVLNEIILKEVRHLEVMSFRRIVQASGNIKAFTEYSHCLWDMWALSAWLLSQGSLSLSQQNWDPPYEYFLDWLSPTAALFISGKKPMVPRWDAENPLLCTWPCGVELKQYLLEKNRTSCWEKVSQVELALWKTTGYGICLYYSFHRLKKKKLFIKQKPHTIWYGNIF